MQSQSCIRATVQWVLAAAIVVDCIWIEVQCERVGTTIRCKRLPRRDQFARTCIVRIIDERYSVSIFTYLKLHPSVVKAIGDGELYAHIGRLPIPFGVIRRGDNQLRFQLGKIIPVTRATDCIACLQYSPICSAHIAHARLCIGLQTEITINIPQAIRRVANAQIKPDPFVSWVGNADVVCCANIHVLDGVVIYKIDRQRLRQGHAGCWLINQEPVKRQIHGAIVVIAAVIQSAT